MPDASEAAPTAPLTACSNDLTRFHVHLFAVIRVTYSEVAAASMASAIDAALESFGASDIAKRFDGETTEFADEFSHFLVDVADDPEFARSRFFTSRQEPLLALLDRLLAWDASGRPERNLFALLRDIREVLAWSV